MKMNKWIKNSIIVALATLLLTVGVANAEVSTPSFFKKLGDNVVLLKNTWDLGSATNKIKKIWALDIEANHIDAGTVDIGGVSSGPLTAGGSATSTIYGDGTTSTIGADLNVVGKLSTPQICLDSNCKTAWPSGGVWGQITGTLSSQTDLQNALNAKLATSSFVWGGIGGTLSSQTDLSNALSAKVPYSGGANDLNIGAHSFTSDKLGTATGVNTTYNSGDIIQACSAWDTLNSTADTYAYKWRAVPTSGNPTAGSYKLVRTKNGGAETTVMSISDAGSLTMMGSVGGSGTISGTNGTFTGTITGNTLYPYNNTFLTLKGRGAGSGIFEQIKLGLQAGSAVENDDLTAYYSDGMTTKIGGVDGKYGFSYQRKGTKQTTDGTQQNILYANGTNGSTAVLTTETGKVYQLTAKVVGKDSTPNFAGCTMTATVKNVAGTASLVGLVTRTGCNQSSDWGTGGLFSDFTFSGADVRVAVTGKTGATINWKMSLDYIAY